MSDEDRILQVRMSKESFDGLKTAAKGVRLENRSTLVRAFADAVARKTPREVRMFLFFDDDDMPSAKKK